MRNLVLVLGAGAAYDFGAPLMKDFYKVASEIFVNTDDNVVKEHFSTVFEFINRLQKAQAKANIDLHNIEQVYTALEMAKLLGLEHLKVKRKSWSQMDDSMRFFLTHNIENQTKLPSPPSIHAHRQSSNSIDLVTMAKPQKNFGSTGSYIQSLKKKGWNVTIVTFNYDLVTEATLSQVNMNVEYCLDGNKKTSDTDVLQ